MVGRKALAEAWESFRLAAAGCGKSATIQEPSGQGTPKATNQPADQVPQQPKYWEPFAFKAGNYFKYELAAGKGSEVKNWRFTPRLQKKGRILRKQTGGSQTQPLGRAKFVVRFYPFLGWLISA